MELEAMAKLHALGLNLRCRKTKGNETDGFIPGMIDI
jgi:hypothetical protein